MIDDRSFLDRNGVKLTILAVFLMFAGPTYLSVRNTNHIGDLARDNQASIVATEHAVRQIQRERHDRINAQTAINAYVCRRDNGQDGLLGRLLIFSLAASPPDAKLTKRQREGKEIFEKALTELQERPNCAKLRIGLGPAVHAK